jgi:hypothetical protein
MHPSEHFNFSAIQLNFCSDRFSLRQDSPESFSPFYMEVKCRHLDWQVSSAVQILRALEPALSVVEKLLLRHMEISRRLSDWHNEVDPTQWRELLRLFSNVEILSVQNEFVEELGRSLHSEDEEMPFGILSTLKELRFSGGSKNDDAFNPFIRERQAAGHPVDLRMVDSSELRHYEPRRS